MAPRHNEIVGKILNVSNSQNITYGIGALEVLMVVWILSKKYRKLNAVTQIAVVLIMNIIEFIKVPELLLWGKWNLLIAILFAIAIYLVEFIWNKNRALSQ